jgi:hypothetical protein
MKLKSKLMMFTAAVAFSASMAQAAITTDDVVKTYQDAAYTSIEVVEGPTQIKVEAIKDGVKLEVIYDKASGTVIKTEQHSVTGTDGSVTGVEVSTSDSDFDDDHGAGSDDGDGHDVGDDHGGDDAGSDDGEGHDVGDDHGGDNTGSDDGDGHDAGDDNGGDDQGDDNDNSGNDDGDDN